MQHLLVTRNFLPDLTGAARRFVALAPAYPEPMSVSTTHSPDAARYDSREDFAIERQSFGPDRADSFWSRLRWERWVTARSRDRVDVLHCGAIASAGLVVHGTHRKLGIPYIVHLTGWGLSQLRERAHTKRSVRRALRLVLGDAAGIVAPTEFVALVARETMAESGISTPPPVMAAGLGADRDLFSPGRDSGTLRQRWGIRRSPILLTVGQLTEHKGQDTGIQALSLLREEFPHLRYVLVGEGVDESRLRNLAADLNVMDRVGFAGPMLDDELPEAYATSTIYLDASRADSDTASEGHGLALLEAQSAGLPVIATDGPNARAIVRDGETGHLLPVSSAESVAEAVAALLRDPEARIAMSIAGREAVESHWNWETVARRTSRFVRECVANG